MFSSSKRQESKELERRKDASTQELSIAQLELLNETKLTGMKMQSDAAVTGRGMELALELDQYRRSLVGSSEDIVRRLIVADFADIGIAKIKSRIREHGTGF